MSQAAPPDGEQGDPLVLWTGGWDSTFRVLWLTCVEGRRVRPYYIAETARASTAAELAAMSAIRAGLARTSPEAAARIQPLVTKSSHDVEPDQEIRAGFERILGRAFVGSQYCWLAEFARQHGLDGLELSIHRDDKAHALLERIVGSGGADEPGRIVPATLKGTDEHLVFGAFRFPVFDLTKVEMQRLARVHGFDGLMELTWFCHAPLANGKPCGRCSPCIYTMEEGMARRLPWVSRTRYHTRVTARLRHFLMRHPSIHDRIRRIRRALGGGGAPASST